MSGRQENRFWVADEAQGQNEKPPNCWKQFEGLGSRSFSWGRRCPRIYAETNRSQGLRSLSAAPHPVRGLRDDHVREMAGRALR